MLLNRAIHKIMNILYGLVMALPLLSIAVTCLYVIINKNAKDSYTGTYTYNSTLVITDMSNCVDKDNTFFIKNRLLCLSNNQGFAFNYMSFSSDSITGVDFDNYKSIVYCYGGSWGSTSLYSDYLYFLPYELTSPLGLINTLDLTGSFKYSLTNISYPFSFNITPTSYINYGNGVGNFFTSGSNLINYSVYSTDNTLSSVFYSSTNRVFESPLFNWVYDSFAYAPIGSFVALFGVATHSFYDCVLTYWLVISLIWIGFEILMFFITFSRQLINNFYSKTERW